MNKSLLIMWGCLLSIGVFGQEIEEGAKVKVAKDSVDLKYREDQFYLGVTHTIMQDKPQGYSASSVSPGVFFGFLRDMPINKSRTLAIAPGVGYGYNKFNGTLISEDIDGIWQDKKHSLTLHKLEFPLEFRWRTSTPESHKFWRVYLGVKASYVFSDKTSNTFDLPTSSYHDTQTNKWLFDMYLSAGFNTWNFYAAYGFTNLYKNPISASNNAKFKTISLGLIFYIL